VLLTRGTRILAWLLLAVIVVLTLAPPGFRPQTPVSHTIEHAGIFLVTGIALGSGYGRRAALLYIAAIVFCAGLEIAQVFDPGRHARVSDFLVDFTAMWAGVWVGSLLSKRAGWDSHPD
jgi:VanZ family protein